MKTTDNNSDLTVVGTKMTKAAAEKLQNCARRMGIKNSYTLLQMITDCIIRFMDAPSEASRQLIDLIDQFDGFAAWTDYPSLSNADKSRALEVTKAIYFIREKGKEKLESYAEMVEFNELKWLGGWAVNDNVNDIITATLRGTRPMLLKRLQRIMKEEGIGNITGAISLLLAEHFNEDTSAYIQQLFSDNERDDWGGKAIATPDMKHKHRRRDLSVIKENTNTIKFNQDEQQL